MENIKINIKKISDRTYEVLNSPFYVDGKGGQLGRCDSYSKENLPGEIILKEAYAAIDRAIEVIGGNLLILECREHMFSKFYEKYNFKKLYDELDNGLYTLYKKIR